MNYYLKIFNNDKDSREFLFEKNEIIIGREDTHLSIKDPSISYRHAMIRIKQDIVEVIDMDSRNGTFINGKKIKKAYLNPGDILKLGRVELILNRKGKGGTQSITIPSVDVPDLISNPQNKSKSKRDIDQSIQVSSKKKVSIDPNGSIELNDFTFDDRYYHSVQLRDILNWEKKDYIDPSDDVFSREDIVDKEFDNDSIKAVVVMNGHVLSMEYFPIEEGTYYVGQYKKNKRTIELPCLNDVKETRFMEIKDHTPFIFNLSGFKTKNTGKELDWSDNGIKLCSGDVLIMEQGVMQFLIQYGKTPPSLKKTKWSENSTKEIKWMLASVFTVVFFMLTSMFLHDKVKEPEKKKVSVVYRVSPELKPILKLKKKPIPISSVIKREENKAKRRPPKKIKSPSLFKKLVQKVTRSKAEKPVKKTSVSKKKKTAKKYSFKKQNNLKNLFKTTSLSGSRRAVRDSSSSVESNVSVKEVSQRSLSSNYGNLSSRLEDGIRDGYDSSSGSGGLSSKTGASKIGYSIPAVVVSKGIDRALLSKILKGLIPQFKHCYQRELVRDSRIEGVINLIFRIHSNGRVSNIKVKGERISFGKEGTNCMKKVLYSVNNFPRPYGSGVVDVKQPLNFSSLDN